MISEKDQIITIYSSLTAKSFVEEVMKLNLIKHCKDKIFIVMSDNVKNELEYLVTVILKLQNNLMKMR